MARTKSRSLRNILQSVRRHEDGANSSFQVRPERAVNATAAMPTASRTTASTTGAEVPVAAFETVVPSKADRCLAGVVGATAAFGFPTGFFCGFAGSGWTESRRR